MFFTILFLTNVYFTFSNRAPFEMNNISNTFFTKVLVIFAIMFTVCTRQLKRAHFNFCIIAFFTLAASSEIEFCCPLPRPYIFSRYDFSFFKIFHTCVSCRHMAAVRPKIPFENHINLVVMGPVYHCVVGFYTKQIWVFFSCYVKNCFVALEAAVRVSVRWYCLGFWFLLGVSLMR